MRRGDAASLGKQHVRNDVITNDTEKTGTRVTIPMLPELARMLKAGPVGDLACIVSAVGKPMSNRIGDLFRNARRQAGIQKSAHGLRKSAAARAANRGATVAQLEAISDGKAVAGRRTTLEAPIAKRWPRPRERAVAEKSERLFPHLQSGADRSANLTINSTSKCVNGGACSRVRTRL